MTDRFGTRTLIVPDDEIPSDRSPVEIVLEIEATTNTRLHDGENPEWFIRLHRDFNTRRDHAAAVSFADYCERQYRHRVSRAKPATIDNGELVVETLRVKNGAFESATIENLECSKPTEAAMSKRRKITAGEANVKARDYLAAHPEADARELAKGISCSVGLTNRLPAWRAVQEQRNKGRKPKKPKAVSLTSNLESTIGEDDDELQRLMAEQGADARSDQRQPRERKRL